MICDACKLSLVPSMTSIQLEYGELRLDDGELKVKRIQLPQAFVLCHRCGDAVATYVRYLVQVGGIDGFGPVADEPRAEQLERKAG